ncbi:hypothetical protein FVR03_01160 [Pontibacter qinzhouensis]|uniref:Uncharacterized protein n=1 Tax=Pontibacter qinzhouensis TaxID=2603253 RepID=A0A5C8KEX3_9BACT|nr:hypothetical protein [Pontibacter qinzhouensis]TXK52352.1 hypothetical protein FVR03_01160 [Pontibacter qinzhouensis]
MTPRTIKINEKLTHTQFGISKPLFDAHVKDKPLPVLKFEHGFYSVEIAGEGYTVHTSDVDRNHHEKIAEEYNSYEF